MNPIVVPMMAMTLAYASPPRWVEETFEQERAIAEISKLGGSVVVTEVNGARNPRISVDLSRCPATDATLEYLKGLTNLQNLDLARTQITDAGLEHLKGLSQLHNLDLAMTKVTDAGLEHLRALTQLHDLGLNVNRDYRCRTEKSPRVDTTPRT